ncbi:GTPase Era [bacterium]|nr:GTPase Era [bacterium]
MLTELIPDDFKSGFIAILGRPNVGKSTLLNKLLGEKVAIITPKPQTTRNRILGVLDKENFQIVFIDTPGIHKPIHRLGEILVKSAYSATRDSDINLFLIDSANGFNSEDIEIIRKIYSKSNTPLILAVNKIDINSDIDIDEIERKIRAITDIGAIVQISALNGTNLDLLLGEIIKILPNGPRYYDKDFLTDVGNAQTAAEIIREKLIISLHQEVPYQSAVIVETFEPKKDNPKIFHIQANIIVARSGQKALVIGTKGKRIKQIGTSARIELEKIFDKKIFLELWVKIRPDWFKKDKFIKEYGYY